MILNNSLEELVEAIKVENNQVQNTEPDAQPNRSEQFGEVRRAWDTDRRVVAVQERHSLRWSREAVGMGSAGEEKPVTQESADEGGEERDEELEPDDDPVLVIIEIGERVALGRSSKEAGGVGEEGEEGVGEDDSSHEGQEDQEQGLEGRHF